MNEKIFKVELIGGGISISDILAILSVIISLASVVWVLYQNYQQKKSERMRLIVTPYERFPNLKEEVFFLKLALSNESSLPISILNMHIYTLGNGKYIPETENRYEGGSIVHLPIDVKHFGSGFFRDYQVKSNTVPFTIPPYASLGVFVAFNAGEGSADLVPYRKIKLEIETSKKLWIQEIDLEPDNLHQFSYDGINVFGKAVDN